MSHVFLQGEWSPAPGPDTSLMECLWIACIYAPVPPPDSNLTKLLYNDTIYHYDTTEVDINQKVEYHCFNGMRNRANPSASAVQGIILIVSRKDTRDGFTDLSKPN